MSKSDEKLCRSCLQIALGQAKRRLSMLQNALANLAQVITAVKHQLRIRLLGNVFWMPAKHESKKDLQRSLVQTCCDSSGCKLRLNFLEPLPQSPDIHLCKLHGAIGSSHPWGRSLHETSKMILLESKPPEFWELPWKPQTWRKIEKIECVNRLAVINATALS